MTYNIRRIDRHWGTHEHCDPYWRLYVNQHSGAYLDIPGGRYAIVPDRVHLIPAWVRLRCRNRRRLKHFYVHFDLIGLSGQVVREVFRRPRCLRRQLSYAQAVEPLTVAELSPDAPDLAVTMYVKSLVVDAIRDLLFALPREKRKYFCRHMTRSNPFAALVRYVDHHLSERLDNQQLAAMSHMSRSHFIRRFHDAIGQTPAAYVLDRRIATAAERLSLTDDSIEKIAAETGFADRFYFTRVFTKRMGIPPAGYRKAVR